MTARTSAAALLLLVSALPACSSSAISADDEGNAGNGGGSGGPSIVPEPVQVEELYRPKLAVPLSATGLAFNASAADELWVTLRQFPSGKPCTPSNDSGCQALQGVVAILSEASSATPSAVIKEDGNSWHFMRRPTSIAWGQADKFATCGEGWTDNYDNENVPYAGPVLWSSDPTIFGVDPKPGQNGTHIDMLHETPYCMGIAWEQANAYWAFNGDAGSLDRYDFHVPHVVGGEDHADGEVHRYIAGQLLRVPEVPSHLAFDASSGLVYVVDTGHARVIAVDPSSAEAGGEITTYEMLHASGEMLGATVLELVTPGLLQKPSGLALSGDTLYVTDNQNSYVYLFDLTGKLLQVIDTALPPASLSGIAVGSDGKLYLADMLEGRVLRVELPAP